MVHAITHANNWEVMWPAVHIGAYVGGGIFHDPSEFLMWDRSDAKFNRKLSAGTTRNFLADRRGNCNYDVTQVCVVSCHDAQLCLTCGILVWCHSLSVRLGQRKASGYRETRALNPDHTLESPIDLPAAGSHGSPETTMLSLMSFWHHLCLCLCSHSINSDITNPDNRQLSVSRLLLPQRNLRGEQIQNISFRTSPEMFQKT